MVNPIKFTMASLGLWVCLAPPAAIGSQERDARESRSKPNDLPVLPQLRLMPVGEPEDEASYVRSIAGSADDLARQASQTDDPMARADLLLEAANRILAYELEPVCTRRLLGIPRPDLVEKAGRPPAAALDRAASMIAQADATLLEIEDAGPEAAEASNRRQRRIRVLLAFTTAIRAFLFDVPGDEDTAALLEAASKLSPILEDSDHKVAAAARFWQACLRAGEADPTPALTRLDPALMKPPEWSHPYGFFTRLLRCRLLVRRGHPAAALSLLMQIEERCVEDWFDPDDRAVALRTVALVRTQILRDWHGQLSPDTHADERKWCIDGIQRLIDLKLVQDDRTVLRLTPAVPLLVVEPPAPQPASGEGDGNDDGDSGSDDENAPDRE